MSALIRFLVFLSLPTPVHAMDSEDRYSAPVMVVVVGKVENFTSELVQVRPEEKNLPSIWLPRKLILESDVKPGKRVVVKLTLESLIGESGWLAHSTQ